VANHLDQPVEKKSLGDAEQAIAECQSLESDLAELKALYEQFFLGFERRPPTQKHEAVKRRMAVLKGLYLRQTSAKFRVQAVGAKLLTYERLWDRTVKEIELGTYRRDVFKARLHAKKRERPAEAPASTASDFDVDEDLDLSDLDEADDALGAALAQATAAVEKKPPAVPSIAPVASPPSVLSALPPLTPVARPVTGSRPIITAPLVSPPPAPPRPSAPMAKKRCGEDTRSLTLDSVASTLKKQVPELMRQHNARSVEFKVVIKDGKAVLRALPKDT
jgi:hypothetical protein